MKDKNNLSQSQDLLDFVWASAARHSKVGPYAPFDHDAKSIVSPFCKLANHILLYDVDVAAGLGLWPGDACKRTDLITLIGRSPSDQIKFLSD